MIIIIIKIVLSKNVAIYAKLTIKVTKTVKI